MKKDNKKNNFPKGIKLNIYWIYGAIFLFFIGIQFFSGNSVQKTNWQEFKNKMLLENKVEKIVIVNKEKAYIHIKDKNLGEPFFERVAKKPFGNSKNFGPHFYFEIGSVDNFTSELKEAQVNFQEEDKIFPYYETRKDVFGDILGWILPLVFFIGIWIFIMRRMSGGGAGAGGQIFSIGKSKATLVDKTNINITLHLKM